MSRHPRALLGFLGLIGLGVIGCSSEAADDGAVSGTPGSSSADAASSTASTGVGGGASSSSSSGAGGTPVYADNFVERAHARDMAGNEIEWAEPPIEMLDVDAHGAYVYGCAAVAGPGALDITTLHITGGEPLPNGSHCDRLIADDKHLVVSSRGGNEVAPTGKLILNDIATVPGDPEYLSFLDLATSPEGMAFINPTLLAVAMRDSGVELFQITSQGKLVSVAKVTALVNAWDVAVSGNKLYVADDTGIGVIDITTPMSPLFEGIVPVAASLKRLDLGEDGVLYAAAAADGVFAFDLTDPSNPALLSSFDTPGSAFDVAQSNGHLFVADWNDLRVLDVSNPAAMKQVAVETPPAGADGLFSRVLSIDSVGDHAYAGEWTMIYDYELLPGSAGPDVDLEVVALNFPTTAVGAESAISLIVKNEGDAPLEITGVTGDATFYPKTTVLSIPPGVKDFIEVRFKASSVAQATGSIVLTTNDPDEPTLTLPTTGNTPGLGVGDQLPNWTWVDLQSGQTISTQALQGSVILLSYFATF